VKGGKYISNYYSFWPPWLR